MKKYKWLGNFLKMFSEAVQVEVVKLKRYFLESELHPKGEGGKGVPVSL